MSIGAGGSDAALLAEFQRIGRELFSTGLNTSHSGNLSVCIRGSTRLSTSVGTCESHRVSRVGTRGEILITRSGSSLHNLGPDDLVRVDLGEEPLSGEDPGAPSSEGGPVEPFSGEGPRQLSGGTGPEEPSDKGGPAKPSRELVVHRAVYRVAGVGAVVHAHPAYAVTLSLSRDRLVPLDVEGSLFLGEIPVIDPVEKVGSRELAAAVAAVLRNGPVVVVRGHGAFAAARSLDAAYHYISALEHTCRILYLTHLLKDSHRPR